MPGEADPLPRLAPGLRRAAARFGTPVQVTDAVTLAGAAARVRAAFPDPWLRAFSVKANDVAGIVARIATLGFDANVVSRGEWAVARRAGLGNDRIASSAGSDHIHGGAGADLIWAWDGTRDWVDGGAGSDRAWLDRFDRTFSIERRG